MALTPGARLGPYEVLGALGAGGMGEVYRARDTRIDREVALKILPSSYAADPDRMRRFQQEARTVGGLSHPNLLVLFDVGTHEGSPYLVSELLDGDTLRGVLGRGPLTVRKAVDYAAQIAKGLAAAHEQGIVHRDLKPENIFVTRDGRVKILDFGLARVRQASAGEGESVETATSPTEPGALLGTLGYMSPEQVRGQAADHRADVFAFGAVLYEMLSGRRAFSGQSPADTLAAILHKDPPELAATEVEVPAALDRISKRCLEKAPAERFQSARDLAFALESLSGSGLSLRGIAATEPVRPPARRVVLLAAGLGGLVALGLAGAYLGRQQAARAGAGLSFHQLTFRQGGLHEARFGPDGNVFYSAHWGLLDDDVYFTRPGNPEGRTMGLGDARLFSVSSSGELALALGASSDGEGTLARLSFPGGAPRELVSGVNHAEWSPAGQDLAVVRGRSRLEFPAGKVLFQSEATIGAPRFSPQGDRMAFFEGVRVSGARDSGTLWMVDLAGNKTRLFSGAIAEDGGLAWSPRGDELWFISRPETGDGSLLRAADRMGKVRDIQIFDGWAGLKDIAPNGDVLLSRLFFHQGLVVIDRDGKEQDLTWLNRSGIADISEDGRTIVFTERIGEEPFVCVRRRGTPDAVRLGEGEAKALSPDGNWVLGVSKETFVLYPLGAGQPRALPLTGIEPPFDIHWALFFPEGKRILVIINFAENARLYSLELETGKLEPLSPEDRSAGTSMSHPFSPDARRLLASVQDDRPYGIYTLQGGGFEDIGLSLADLPIRWSADGRYVFYVSRPDLSGIHRLDLQSRRKELWKELLRVDAMSGVSWVVTTGDGKAVAYSYAREQADLYLVKGLR